MNTLYKYKYINKNCRMDVYDHNKEKEYTYVKQATPHIDTVFIHGHYYKLMTAMMTMVVICILNVWLCILHIQRIIITF